MMLGWGHGLLPGIATATAPNYAFKMKAKQKKIDKSQAGFLLLNKEKSNLSMESVSFREKLQVLLTRIKGEDNYLTSITVFVGIAAFLLIATAVTLAILPASTKKAIYNQFAGVNALPKPTPAPTPTPIPLPKGPREFGVSTQNNPQITDLKFSEYDPAMGQSQTITVSLIGRTGNVASVEIALKTDNKITTYPLKLSSGTPRKGDWTTTISTNDTHNYIYSMVITAKDDKGQMATVNPIFR